MMTWTRDSTHGWRDLCVIFGQDFETYSFFDRDSIHIKRALSFIFGLIIKSFTVMTWTPPTHGCRDMSVEAGRDFEATCLSDRDSIETRRDMSFLFGQDCQATPCSDRSSIHAWRDMSVTKPPHETAVHHRSRLIFEKLAFIKNWKNGKVILDFELEK